MSQVHSKEDLESLSIYRETMLVQQTLAAQMDTLIKSDFCLFLGNVSENLVLKQSNDRRVNNPSSEQFEKNISEIRKLDQRLESFPENTNELRLVDAYLRAGLRDYR